MTPLQKLGQLLGVKRKGGPEELIEKCGVPWLVKDLIEVEFSKQELQ